MGDHNPVDGGTIVAVGVGTDVHVSMRSSGSQPPHVTSVTTT